ncbi:MAG: 2-C-methyl-D-erythritol 4-phosphate cytidylyltransferase, partial [Burkholderiales bacterium]|nr:2-C-methyl-D-erythritol 4-phosphate cytidylyltransferase [Phycisphaerae bacterium]
VIDKAEAEEIRRKIGSHLMFMGIKLIQSGGDWYEQLADAQKALSPDAKRVLVHDGARPAVPYTNIDALIEESTKHPAAGLALPVRGATVEAGVVPGAGKVTATRVAVLQWPMIYSRAAFDAVAASKKQPETIQFIEGSPLNVRCGIADASLVKAMIGLLPKPKMKVQSSPFEEAQW